MKRKAITVWQDEEGRTILERKGPNEWYITVGTVDCKSLHQLWEACDDALDQAKKEEGKHE